VGLLDFPAHENLNEAPMFFIEPKDRGTDSEDQRQRKVVAECRRLGLFIAHIPQSGRRSDYERTKLHRNGAIAGVPDLVIQWTGGIYWAEMKDGTKGPSRAQIDVMNDLVRRNIPCGVHRGWESLAPRLAEAGAPIGKRQCHAAPIGDAAKRVVLRMIDLETDPSERKAKIMIAREEGVIDDDETADLIRRYALVFA
jgi:hypothetical protein